MSWWKSPKGSIEEKEYFNTDPYYHKCLDPEKLMTKKQSEILNQELMEVIHGKDKS